MYAVVGKLMKGFNLNLTYRKSLLLLLDIILINVASFGAVFLRTDFRIPEEFLASFRDSYIITTLIFLIVFRLFNLYKSVWRYASIEEMNNVIFASIAGGGTLFVLYELLIPSVNFPRSYYVLMPILIVFLVGGMRFSYRAVRRAKNVYFNGFVSERKRVLIVGGGEAGSMIIQELFDNPQLLKYPVAVVDDNPSKNRAKIHGVPILGTRADIHEIVKVKKVDEIIIAIPSAGKAEIKELANVCKETRCKLKTIPGVFELINGQVDVKKIRDVNIEDLLGRDPIKVNLTEICKYISSEVVLITGGGGSIGTELCRQIARFNPKQLIILDIYENNAYEIQQELIKNHSNLNLEVIIASVRDRKRMESIFEKYRPGVVFHAAAHKHVPLMEANPAEAIKNNVFGSLNVAECADKFGTKRFVLISTDKAVNPTNIMGASKRTAEMVIQSLDKKSKTEFVAVRFGNVLGSNGSVIPRFKKQISDGGPVTVTHPEIIRYFMTIPEAVQLVIQAGSMAKGGEIFILDMGEPVKIVDLARDLIKLSGFEPDKDIKLHYTGLRPGEKLYEELLLAEEGISHTRHEKIFIGKPVLVDYNELNNKLNWLREILVQERADKVDKIMQSIVAEYKKADTEKSKKVG
ncbi:nucleoside-diphosphate sugar epimerase/dehydratase [Herbivorax sp. ANBcel31]|uniref:polysaccharide biosynthesis protein n=1 Tax=Herbivorax sp. ANBcel31 TaxID=3069754 RepID=UPI0027B1535B|nr:nucleoside-diphosphate sugar epimerase/dehydratase [Herbivorax sp. ANBcel31]MDQ2085668.1 nucleoside-diphosphate sugar epimerase/dehydratase [Herbivorax sp. ANBcel31]